MGDGLKYNSWIEGFDGIADIVADGYSVYSFEELFSWINERKKRQKVSIEKISIGECDPWYYDDASGEIRNKDRSFFQVAGLTAKYPDREEIQQPIIIQNEIGFLGIVCKKINGVWHFLMQAKIEPGNINYVQVSPTIQATKSNFTCKHGGRKPLYLELFTDLKRCNILVDQIQSEQSSRFIGKRNRNIIIKVDEDIEEYPSHRWMTLFQIKEFMKYDNLVNMDTRTVLSCIPYVFMSDSIQGYSDAFIQSIKSVNHNDMVDIYLRINNYKMFNSPQKSIIPLKELSEWRYIDDTFRNINGFPFEVVFCNLNIEGREVTEWKQPLFAALGTATFALVCCLNNNVYEALVQIKPEVGCFDCVELGPSVQEECGNEFQRDSVANAVFEMLENNDNIVFDVVLSEEGGRFYHEQNRNVVLLVDKDKITFDQSRYVWVTLGTLNALTQLNNCVNIQLRNLLMLLSMYSKI